MTFAHAFQRGVLDSPFEVFVLEAKGDSPTSSPHPPIPNTTTDIDIPFAQMVDCGYRTLMPINLRSETATSIVKLKYIKAPKLSVAVYDAFKPNSTITLSDEISNLVMKNH